MKVDKEKAGGGDNDEDDGDDGRRGEGMVRIWPE
jgi:hypothetical protein